MSDNLFYTLEEFRNESKLTFLDKIQKLLLNKGFDSNEAQIRSWDDCFDFLQRHLPDTLNPNLLLIFEYMLPLEGGKRPDVIILSDQQVVILEFKRKNGIVDKDLEQAINYRKNIQNYHYVTADNKLNVNAYMVYTLDDIKPYEDHNISILTADNFTNELSAILSTDGPFFDNNQWLDSVYQPLDSLLKATKKLFEESKLPQIKRIEESDINNALTFIRSKIENNSGEKNLIFVSGVPGSGKTLVGLKTVYDFIGSDLKPIFLSGNGPLVSVLQHLLSNDKSEGKSVIRPMFAYKREYNQNKATPQQSDNLVIVFDEAQRAWDDEKNKNYGKSEPKVLLEIADSIYRKHGRVNVICLIGDGQAIHTGEEKGMNLWYEAVKERNDWNIIIPPTYENEFHDSNYSVDDDLFLDVSIRNDLINISPWIDAILSADLESAKKTFTDLFEEGFKARLFNKSDLLPGFVHHTKKELPNDHIGLYISSKVKHSNYSKVFPNWKVTQLTNHQAVDWYLGDSKNLNQAATEFQSQGLESEWPIVTFGGDYYLSNGNWKIAESVENNAKNQEYEDLETIIENIYRVLLSRSRKGIYIYIPDLPELEETYKFFEEMGIQPVPDKERN